MSFEKPETIKAYVWDVILRGHNVAFVSGARGGKTLGNIMKGPITVNWCLCLLMQHLNFRLSDTYIK
jgi:hypothetical protein